MVSCRFSHQPIHLNTEYEKQPRDHSYGETPAMTGIPIHHETGLWRTDEPL